MRPAPERKSDSVVILNEKSYRKQIILLDANVPYKLSIDRQRNNLFFCINADEFSNQSFHSVVLDLDTKFTSVIPGIRNGFASTVDPYSGDVYLGGSDGIFKFNYDTQDIEKPALVQGADIFDLYFHKYIYFVETANQNLFRWENGKKHMISEIEGYLIHHFVVTDCNDIVFVNSTGVHMLQKGARAPVTLEGVPRNTNIRGATIDVNGKPHFIAHDGMYEIDMKHRQVMKILPLENGYGLAFDKYNNMVYSDDRSVTKLVPIASS